MVFAGHEDLHAPNIQFRAFVIAFLAPSRWKRTFHVLHEPLRVYDHVAKTIQQWKRKHTRREREKEKEWEKERERERVSREGARDEVTRPCTIPTIRLIIIPNRFANTATRAAEFHRFLRISLLLSFLFRLLPLTRSPSFVILSTRRKCEYISCILSFFFLFFFFFGCSIFELSIFGRHAILYWI